MSRIYRNLMLASALAVTMVAAHAQVAAPAPASKVETFLVPIRLTVALDGSGEYRTIQEAVMAVRDFMQVPAVIFR